MTTKKTNPLKKLKLPSLLSQGASVLGAIAPVER